MAREKAVELPFTGQVFWIDKKIPNPERHWLAMRVAAVGGTVLGAIDATVNYLLLAEERRADGGTSTPERTAAKARAAAKAVFYDDSHALLRPSREAALALLHADRQSGDQWRWALPMDGSGLRVDLTGADLSGLDLTYIDFGTCDLDGVRLDGARLFLTTFRRAKHIDFRPAKAENLDVRDAEDCTFDGMTIRSLNLEGPIVRCSFRDVSLRRLWAPGAVFDDSDLSGVQATEGYLGNVSGNGLRARGLKLPRFDLRAARLPGADLADADLTEVKAERIDLARAGLRGGRLVGADLRQANLAGADLTGADLRSADLSDADLSGAVVAGADFTGASLRGANLAGVAVETATGLTDAVAVIPTAGPVLKTFLAGVVGAKKVKLTLTLESPTRGFRQVEVEHEPAKGRTSVVVVDAAGRVRLAPPSLEQALLDLRGTGFDAVPRLDTATARRTPSDKAFGPAFVRALCELFGLPVPEEKAVGKARKAAKDAGLAQRNATAAELAGPGGVKAWNARPAVERKSLGKFDGVDLAKAKLRGVDLSGTSAAGANLAGADLRDAKLREIDLRKANLRGADLRKADLGQARCAGLDAEGADLRGVETWSSDWTGAKLIDANLEGADFRFAHLKGADLTGANLDGLRVSHTEYDEATTFPAGYVPGDGWLYAGETPLDAPAEAAEAIDFDAFFRALPEAADGGRIRDAVAMLRKERFHLFTEVADDHVVGVVRSQSTPDRVYACRLAADGQYSCGTQNVRPCGGLSGSVCKHLLVLLIGLAKAGPLEAGTALAWLRLARRQKPTFDKDALTATFLKYKGVADGDVDWRPTETVPEDYYAL